MNRNLLAATFVVVAISGEYATLAAESESLPNDVAKTTSELQSASILATARHKAGKELLLRLQDNKLPTAIRLECAKTLVRLNYVEAIPVLVELIDLANPEWIDTSPNIRKSHPCVEALADFGVAAIPDLVKAWIEEKEKKRSALLYFTIKFIKERQHIRTYIIGFAHSAKDEEAQAKALQLLKKIDSR